MLKLLFPHRFAGEPPMRIVTNEFAKHASFCPPEIAAFCADLKPVEGKTYLHLNALGAGETWGSNVNGDYFPKVALTHKGASHGYKTFELFANVYQHHVNKDPAKAMGRVKIAAYNPVMERVELIVEVDNSKGSGLIEKVASGEYPDWSMGCKVPYDTCSDCGNKAKKVVEYCEHLKTAMNKIAENGHRTYAVNDFPKFFDISEVVIGADKTAKTLRKVAGAAGRSMSSALLALHVYGEQEPDLTKVAMRAPKAQEPGLPVELLKLGRRLYRTEPEFPAPLLQKFASFEMPQVLSTLSYAGVVLHPSEFQRIALVKAGRAELAEKLAKAGIVFPRLSQDDADLIEAENDGSIHPSHVTEAVYKVAEPYLKHRSIFDSVVQERVDRLDRMVEHDGPSNITWIKTADAGLLEILGALGLSYFLYRRGFPVEAKAFEQVMVQKPWLGPLILGGAAGTVGLSNALAGPSARTEAIEQMRQAQIKVGSGWKTIGTVLGPVGLAYLAAASAARKELTGYELSPMERLVRHYPGPLGILGVYGLIKARGALSSGALKALAKP